MSEITKEALIRKVVGLCNRVPGSTQWNAAEWMYDELSALSRPEAIGEPEPVAFTTQHHLDKLKESPGGSALMWGEPLPHHPDIALYTSPPPSEGEKRMREAWQSVDSAPKEGFFLAWSPDHPDLVMTWKAEIFHQARKPGTPRHLSANHFTLWMPIPLPGGANG